MSDDLRKRLIDRIWRLPPELLVPTDEWLERLERGEPSPLGRPIAGKMESGGEPPHSKDWPHAPVHRISEHGTYFVTAGTLHKKHVLRGPRGLDLVENALLSLAKQYGWHLEAWAVFSNHYHFVGHAVEGSADLKTFLTHLHGDTAREINRQDDLAGRQVWYNFWDTKLTYEKSYLARLSYAHQNAVKHGLVRVAREYRWCSAAWFERTASPAQVRTIYSFKTDRVRVRDDYEPLPAE
jgi:putative transposase